MVRGAGVMMDSRIHPKCEIRLERMEDGRQRLFARWEVGNRTVAITANLSADEMPHVEVGFVDGEGVEIDKEGP